MENKVRISNKIKYTLLAVVLIVFAAFILTNHFQDQSAGKITVRVVQLDGTLIEEKVIPFTTDDTLADLVQQNFDHVVISDGFLYSISTLTTPDDWSSFICIYVNDQQSQIGINDIVLEDQLTVSFVDTKMAW